jgi:predicted lipid-binding transport protein (Tim44 family)
VPLSEHEQRQLEQIEQALYAEHPRFARAVRANDPRVHYRRRVIQAALGFLVGVGLLVAGVATKDLWIGVAGFVVMLACSMWALTSYRHMTGITSGRGRERRPGKPAKGKAPSHGVMERLEERWRRRQERDR